MCILCVRVKINKRSFEPVCVWVSPFMLLFVSTCIDQDHNTHRVKKTAYFIRQYCEPVWPSDKTLGRYAEGPQFKSASALILFKSCGLCTLSCDFVPHSYETLKWLSSLPTLMQKSFWWQCSDRYIISLSKFDLLSFHLKKSSYIERFCVLTVWTPSAVDFRIIRFLWVDSLAVWHLDIYFSMMFHF